MITSLIQFPPLNGRQPAFTDGASFSDQATWTEVDNGAVLAGEKEKVMRGIDD